MPEQRFPTLEEFWRRLEAREVEDDLKQQLRARTDRQQGAVSRVGDEETVIAVAARLLPGKVPAKALAVFLDEVFDEQLGRGDERVGLMPRQHLIPTGFRLLDDEAHRGHGRGFAQLDEMSQDRLLERAEKGQLSGPAGFESATWFKRMRGILVLAFGSDPRGMVQMGFPGPSYKTGHIWLDEQEVRARAQRKIGYLKL